MILIIAAVALSTAVDSSNVGAQITDGAKLGFVDTLRILDEVNIVKEKREELKDTREKAEAELQKQYADLNQRRSDLEAKKEILLPDEYERQKAGLQKELIDLNTMKSQKESELVRLYRETIRPIRARINEVVQEIAKEDGFAFVFLKDNLAYGAAQYDITEKVVVRLNQ